MSVLDRIAPALHVARARFDGRRASAAVVAPAVENGPPSGGPAVSPRGLRERRTRLTRELAELQWDLGGACYEMAIRDHFRLDVLTRVAGELQAVDAELGEVERLVALEDSGAAGFCANCRALHSRGAAFCWQCGERLLADARTDSVARADGEHAPDATTGVMEPANGAGERAG